MIPKLGSGGRFKQVEKSLEAKGIRNPAAMAASIGREKYGDKKMTQLASKGKTRHAEARQRLIAARANKNG